MVEYLRAIDTPLRMQWDADSRLPPPDPGTAGGNCGMAAAVMVIEYYTDVKYPIYATRRLVTSSLKLSTTVAEQRDAIKRRGVPCRLSRPTISQIHAILASGRRPIIVGMDMGLVPDAIAGHDFQDDHAVVLRANASGGTLAADPNFSTRTGRLDPTRGRRFYPDSVLRRAYWDAGKWAIVPDRDKIVTQPVPVEEEMDANRFIPVARCDVASGGSVYADPDRQTLLIASWQGQGGVGLYARPASSAEDLAPIRIEVSGKLRVGYVGKDKISNIR